VRQEKQESGAGPGSKSTDSASVAQGEGLNPRTAEYGVGGARKPRKEGGAFERRKVRVVENGEEGHRQLINYRKYIVYKYYQIT
jgi:hypothetical protein